MASAGGRSGGKGTGKPGGSGRASKGGRPVSRTAKAGASAAAAPRTRRVPTPTPTPAPPPAEPGPFRLGAVEGATPGKWIGLWKTRMPHVALELVPLSIGTQRVALDEASIDAAIVRMPLDVSGLHVIALYDEEAVVVCPAESHLTTADELTLADLAGEVVVVPLSPPLAIDVPGAVSPAFAPPATVEEAIETVAAGVGIVIVPMSLARLHQRKDVAHRPLRGAPASPVALVWPEGATTSLVETFVGIVRGRTSNSSR